MKNITILGAGRSASSLINYLIERAPKNGWHITVGEYNLELAKEKTKGLDCASAIFFDVHDEKQRQQVVQKADIIISMLPAYMHTMIARECVQYGKHMLTASYVSKEMEELHEEAQKKGVLLLNEIGLDPGIDHMSAMKMIEQAKSNGYELEAFESFTGGLLAPESENNPWKYKFTWNPRNVVIAGHGGAVKFRHNGRYKYIPYHKLFRRTELIDIEGYGRFEGYANRDSLSYVDKYGLQGIPTIYRGTLRRPGFCRAWDAFVQLGATDDSYIMEGSEDMTYRDFINSFLAYNAHDSVELKLMYYLKLDQDSDVIEKLHSLNIFSNTKVGIKNATPAQILQKILEESWTLDPNDKDMIVMHHKVKYKKEGELYLHTADMVIQGEDAIETAMSKTVGLPIAVATELLLEGKISLTGVQIPVKKEIYLPVLDKLEPMGVRFIEKEVKLASELPVM
ncbi:saccharopine dehydrogenase C-terminal domain-containing protein [Algivirga pacifica]|uniref:Saccharopine dehydrogenase C-terminal domain-containing protein n=1 Tax=Algivirga pacifica TaxID=1162670 RepID=A0ABP9DG75_9BACT